jgi:ABC-type glycerol-3-phosphate transport system substrate-binding protein
MPSFTPETTVRVMQEDWAPFLNLRRTTQRFTEKTGIKVEVTLSRWPELWTLMERSFTEDPPPFDLVGCDELLLLRYALAGRVQTLDGYVAADGYALDDFEPAALEAVTHGGHLCGIPYAQVSNVLIYRRDLFEKHNIPLPNTMDELIPAALAVQEAVRADGTTDFYGITLRAMPNSGQNFWIMGSTWAPAWGVKWYDETGRPTLDTPEHLAALEHYVSLLQRAGPPEALTMGFEECMACYRAGRAAMVIEPANEASTIYAEGGQIANGTMTTVVPAGPLGTRHAGLYCPPYAIPAYSRAKEAAWELAKFLCAQEQLLDDAQHSGFVEVARRSVLYDPQFEARFRLDLVEATRATRAFARGERPVNRYSFQFGDILGEEYGRALAGTQTPREAVRRAQERVTALELSQ